MSPLREREREVTRQNIPLKAWRFHISDNEALQDYCVTQVVWYKVLST